jgi:hypothetical protein
MATRQAQIGGEIVEITDGDIEVRPMKYLLRVVDHSVAGNYTTMWIDWYECTTGGA